MKKIKVTVESITGHCAAGCQVGDVFYYDGGAITIDKIDTILCTFALPSLITYLAAAWREANSNDSYFSWIHKIHQLQCPDIANKVIFRLERID